MGHWVTYVPHDFQLFFSGHFKAAQRLKSLSHWTLRGCLPRTNTQAYTFVTVYCMNFTKFLCVTLKLFSLSFAPLLAGYPGDATVGIYVKSVNTFKLSFLESRSKFFRFVNGKRIFYKCYGKMCETVMMHF